jgi:hypothetical protein
LQSVPKSIAVTAAIAEQTLCLLQIVQQGGYTGTVADLSGRRDDVEGAPIHISERLQLGIDATFRATNRVPEIPFLTRTLGAVRCAFR